MPVSESRAELLRLAVPQAGTVTAPGARAQAASASDHGWASLAAWHWQ